MAGKREKPEEIVSKLRQVEVLQGQGITVAEAVPQIGVTQQTFYRWHKLEPCPLRTRKKNSLANYKIVHFDQISLKIP